MAGRDDWYRVPGWLRQQAGLGRVGPDARTPARSAYGLAIENIERACLSAHHIPAASYSVTATDWSEPDAANLSWEVWVSGRRPILLNVTCLVTPAAGQDMKVSLTWDGVEVTGTANGMAFAYAPAATTLITHLHGVHQFEPAGGAHRLAFVTKVGGGTGTLYGGAGNRILVHMLEI